MADDPKVVNDHIDSVTLPTTELVYEGEAKREFVKKMAKLTVRVNPPPRLFFLILVNVIWTMPKAIPLRYGFRHSALLLLCHKMVGWRYSKGVKSYNTSENAFSRPHTMR